MHFRSQNRLFEVQGKRGLQIDFGLKEARYLVATSEHEGCVFEEMKLDKVERDDF